MVSSTDAIPDDAPSAPTRTPARAILGSVNSVPTAVSGATQLAPSMRLSKSVNGAKMAIFSDAAGEGAGADVAPGEWSDIATRDARRKENTVEAGPWKGETLPQSAARGRIASRTSKMEVFKDLVSILDREG